ncbi:hypothetical protein SAMD00023353_0102010 [Rosellinia necatrix]|uniref:Uncharacterized protein n=1 Tax=Rosellinia necatrix TaxID=77044 RepID=A0A1S7UK27_ROSNE|nr:hypothetical protein SAMD00023353_0102010 [Rosellinia necatrix]
MSLRSSASHNMLNPSAGFGSSMLVASSMTRQQNHPQIDKPNPQQETNLLELEFVPNNPSFIRARDDGTVYWSSSYKELSHPSLFIRAAKTRQRLAPDLKNTLIKLSKSKKRRLLNGGRSIYDLEPPESRYELRLTGHATVGVTKRIAMTGCVWIQCSDKYSIWIIKKRLEELTWLKSSTWAPVHLYLEPIIAANTGPQLGPGEEPFDYRSGVDIGGGFQLHVDIAQTGETNSLCGRPCRSRITFDSKVLDESYSRIGGILRINSSIDALVTTAHGILNYFIIKLLLLLEEGGVAGNHSDISDDSSDEDFDDADINEFLLQVEQSGIATESSHTDRLGYLDMTQFQEWESVRPFDSITHIAHAVETNNSSKWGLSFKYFDADYAIFKHIEKASQPQSPTPSNLYTIDSSDSNNEFERRTLLGNQRAGLLTEPETCYILLGAQKAIPAQFFPGEVEISIHDIKFKTLKLLAPKVLAQGTSGSWVVREGRLRGVIIAIYEFDPYALVLPAAVFRRHLTEFGSNINTISFPLANNPLETGNLGEGRLRSTIISTFDGVGISSPKSEPATGVYSRGTSDDTPSIYYSLDLSDDWIANMRHPRSFASLSVQASESPIRIESRIHDKMEMAQLRKARLGSYIMGIEPYNGLQDLIMERQLMRASEMRKVEWYYKVIQTGDTSPGSGPPSQ